jgi:hypothetical protein
MDKEIRHNIRLRWFYSLFEFAHLDFQKRLWLETAYPDSIGDYTECIYKYIYDLGLEEGYSEFLQHGIVTKEEFEIVSDFHDQAISYINRPEKQTLSDKHILIDPEWISLTLVAKASWDRLKITIDDTVELGYMNELEKRYLEK